MKKNIAGLTLLFVICMLLSGCALEKSKVTETEINKVTVYYEYDTNEFRRVEVDFAAGEKNITNLKEASQKDSRAFDNGDELRHFLADTVIPIMQEENEKKEDTSEEKLVWKIDIRVEDASMIAYGIGDDGFPDYWDELLVKMGEDSGYK